MASVSKLWAKLVLVFDVFTSSPGPFDLTKEPIGLQQPIPPIQPVEVARYPIFNPPDELTDTAFRCEYPDYPEKDGWKLCNTRDDRGCWLENTITGQTYGIHTDYENDGPRGIIRQYYLEVVDDQLNPDGCAIVPAQLFNASFPGPRLQACWGDQVQITIKNKLKANGTTVHWHGLRQLNTGHMDGVNAITQCPIAPGEEFTYVFNATQYGTSWYHSHYSLQYAAGLMGPFTIYGPTSKEFDQSLYPIILSDWLHTIVYNEWDDFLLKGSRIKINNMLQSGVGQCTNCPASSNCKKPEYHTVNFQKGIRYLLRIINGAADTTFVFSIDNHKFWVISTDFVSIKPFYTDHIVVGIGQRYNIIVEAIPDSFTDDQSFWICTTPSPNCTLFRGNPAPDERTGIIRYEGASDDLPTTHRQNFEPTCADETYYNDKHNITPIVNWTVSKDRHELGPFYLTTSLLAQFPYYPCDKKVFRFELFEGSPMWLNFSKPTLLNLHEDYSKKPWLAHVDTGKVDEEHWIQMTIISGAKKSKEPTKPHPVPKLPGLYVPGSHPIHLHGHDFAILDQCVPDENTECDVRKNTADLSLINPPRRDVAFLPDGGYLIIAFKADNPGVWLMHCHIAFHASMGLALQIAENINRMNLPIGWDEPFFDMCKQWDAWDPSNASDPCMFNDPNKWPLQADSGI